MMLDNRSQHRKRFIMTVTLRFVHPTTIRITTNLGEMQCYDVRGIVLQDREIILSLVSGLDLPGSDLSISSPLTLRGTVRKRATIAVFATSDVRVVDVINRQHERP